MHPAIQCERAALEDVLGPRLAQCDAHEFATLDYIELFIAAGCALGDTRALQLFEANYFTGVAPALRHMNVEADVVAEVTQRVRLRLFVAAAGAVPRVLAYAGNGKLIGLVRTTAVRLALNYLRATGRLVSDDDSELAQKVAPNTPESSTWRTVHQRAMQKAFATAVEGLAPRERTLLRLSYLKGVSIDGLGKLYGVHRATAARWVGLARETLRERVRTAFAAELGDSLMTLDDDVPLWESNLELSVARLLASQAQHQGDVCNA